VPKKTPVAQGSSAAVTVKEKKSSRIGRPPTHMKITEAMKRVTAANLAKKKEREGDGIVVDEHEVPRIDAPEHVFDNIEKLGRETFHCNKGDVLKMLYAPMDPNPDDRKYMGKEYVGQVMGYVNI
jgi:hypothetical protein